MMQDAPAHPAWKLRYAPPLGFPGVDEPFFLHTLGTADPVAQIAHMARLGFAGVEDNLLGTRSPEMQERIGAALAGHGMAMGCSLMLPGRGRGEPVWQRGDADSRALLRSELASAAAAARRAGGRFLTVVASEIPGVPLGFQLGAMIATLRALADEAGRLGVTLVLEATARARVPDALMDRLEWAWLIASELAHPHVRLVLDVLHVQMGEGDLLNKARHVWDFVDIIQLADCPDRLEPGSGEMNFPAILRFFRDQGFTGLVELEHRKSRPGHDGEVLALARLREIDAAI